jgi:hypothetical protein
MAQPPYPFLSAPWITAARKIRDTHRADAGEVPAVRANLVVTEVPFGDSPLLAHLDSTSGALDLDTGHVEEPDVTVTVDYATSKALFVQQDPQAFMQAFLAGKVRLQGDLSKLVALGASVPTTEEGVAAAKVVAAALTTITA